MTILIAPVMRFTAIIIIATIDITTPRPPVRATGRDWCAD